MDAAAPELPACPDPRARAPREAGRPPTRQRLLPVPPGLQGAVVALVVRDTRGADLAGAQRLTHFPVSPLLTLTWFQGLDAGLVDAGEPARWRPFGSRVVVAGSQSRPVVSWAPGTGRGGMLCFTADVARALFGIDPGAVHDRFLPAAQVLDASWAPLCEALLAADDDARTLEALRLHLAPRWQAAQGRPGAAPSLRQLGRHWVERLALQALDWTRTRSPRQVERRVKAFSGRSLRQWQALVRIEGVFFAARDRWDAGEPPDWAGLAQDEGFADQAHLVRTTRRMTGFTPTEFAQRFAQDESFWLYRLWV